MSKLFISKLLIYFHSFLRVGTKHSSKLIRCETNDYYVKIGLTNRSTDAYWADSNVF